MPQSTAHVARLRIKYPGYFDLVDRAVREFGLSPDGDRTVVVEAMFQDFKRHDARVALEWDDGFWMLNFSNRRKHVRSRFFH